jgi:hypothetical protein
MRYFLIVLLTIYNAFALGYFFKNNGFLAHNMEWKENLANAYLYLYTEIYGDFNFDYDGPIRLLLFVTSTLLMPLVMVNLLIAILSNTFEKVTAAEGRAIYLQKCCIICDLELLLFWNANKERLGFIVCGEVVEEVVPCIER